MRAPSRGPVAGNQAIGLRVERYLPRATQCATGLVALCLLAVAGCSRLDEDIVVHPRGNTTIAEARNFPEFPLYFPGTSVGGLRLEAILRQPSSPAHTEFTFLYGTCRIRRGLDGGCSPPLAVLIWPECYRYETRYSIPRRQRVTVRGVPGRLFRPGGGRIGRLELYPARVTIVLNDWRAEGADFLLRIARQLRGLNVRLPPAVPLPERPPHVAGATPRCRA